MVALVPAAVRRTCRRTAVARGAHGASPSRSGRGPVARSSSTRSASRTQDAAGRYAQAIADADSLERFNRQLEEQVRSQEEEIASIEQQLLDIETTNREVQPLMQQMVDTLEPFVAARRAVPARRAHGSRAELEEHHAARGRRRSPRSTASFSRPTRSSSTTADARSLRRPARHGRRRAHRRVRPARARLVDVSHARRRGDGLLGCHAEDVGRGQRATQKPSRKPFAWRVDDGAPDLLTVPVPAPQEVRS